LIITTERLVDTEEFRRDPRKTSIPYWQVDAVCLVPFGSFPGNMPFEYFSDERHLAEWVAAEEDEECFSDFLDHYIYGVPDFETYLRLAAGSQRLAELREMEILKR
jgi:glutaconate CoA-transferase subunit A